MASWKKNKPNPAINKIYSLSRSFLIPQAAIPWKEGARIWFGKIQNTSSYLDSCYLLIIKSLGSRHFKKPPVSFNKTQCHYLHIKITLFMYKLTFIFKNHNSIFSFKFLTSYWSNTNRQRDKSF